MAHVTCVHKSTLQTSQKKNSSAISESNHRCSMFPFLIKSLAPNMLLMHRKTKPNDNLFRLNSIGSNPKKTEVQKIRYYFENKRTTNEPLPSVGSLYGGKLRVISYNGACQTLASSTKHCSMLGKNKSWQPSEEHLSLLKFLITASKSVASSKASCAFNNKGLASCNKN